MRDDPIFPGRIDDLIPESLDDIIRSPQARERFQIRLASGSEIEALGAKIPSGAIKDIIDDWRLIVFSDRQLAGSPPDLMLLGDSRGRGFSWITSIVLKLDLEHGTLLTRNSLYGLGERGEGEPPPEHLLRVCAALHDWGLGKPLGAPRPIN